MSETLTPAVESVTISEARKSKRPRADDDEGNPTLKPQPSTLKPELLLCVTNALSVPIPRPEPSTFLPNASTMMAVVAIADSYIMVNDGRFVQHNPTWHPILTRIYCGILFYIQTLRVMRHMRTISAVDLTFITNFEREYPPEAIPIPSYIEPFIKSLTSTFCEYTEFGLIGPKLPKINLNADDYLVFPPLERSYLPDLVCLYTAYQTVTRPGNASVLREFDRNLIDPLSTHGQPIGPSSNYVLSRDVRLSPGMKEALILGSRSPMSFATTPGLIPVPRHPLVPITSWQPYLFPTESMSWFNRLLLLMQEYCVCWPSSSTLSRCSLFDGNFPLVEVFYTKIYTEPPRDPDEREFDNTAIATLRTMNITDDTVKLACYSQINATHNYTYVPGATDDTQIFTDTHDGPYWAIRPNRRYVAEFTSMTLVPDALSNNHVTYARKT